MCDMDAVRADFDSFGLSTRSTVLRKRYSESEDELYETGNKRTRVGHSAPHIESTANTVCRLDTDRLEELRMAVRDIELS